MPNLQDSPWSDNPVHRLRELIASGLSAAGAANALTTETGRAYTRHMTQTKARGLGLRFAGKAGAPRRCDRSAAPSSDAPAKRLAAGMRGSGARSKRHTLEAIGLQVERLRTIPARGVARCLLERPASGCAWPVSDWLEPGTIATPFCCAEVEPGRPYCADHLELSLQRERAA